MNTPVVNNNVYQRRQEAGLTQAGLADKVGVTRQTIIAIEKGKYTPSVALAIRLSQILKTRVERLFWI